MKAPEKIILSQDKETGEIHDERIVIDDCITFNNSTDTFIEKACEWLEAQEELAGISFQEDFVERFKQYMKFGKI